MKHRLFALLLIVALLAIPAATALAAPEDIFGVKFSGVIDAVPGEGETDWTIAGFTLHTDDDTLVKVFGAETAADGMWADVMAVRTGEDEFKALKLFVRQPELRLIGPVESIDEETGEWVVAGISILATEETLVSDREPLPAVEGWVEVHALYVDEVLTATRVRGVEPRQEVELFGAIEEVAADAWVISGITVAVTEDTKVMGTPVTGLLVQVAADLTGDGLVARRLAVQWLEPKRGLGPAQFRGEIVDLPDEGLAGEWIVNDGTNDRTVLVTETTRIMQVRGLVEEGAQVHVIGKTDEDEKVNAFVIVVLSSPNATRPFVLAGRIDALPEELVGEWTVNGKTFTVTGDTEIIGEKNAEVGAVVFVQGVEKADGTRVAMLVLVKGMRDVAPVSPAQ